MKLASLDRPLRFFSVIHRLLDDDLAVMRVDRLGEVNGDLPMPKSKLGAVKELAILVLDAIGRSLSTRSAADTTTTFCSSESLTG